MAADFRGPVLSCHRDVEAIAVFDPMRSVEWPVGHVAGFEIDHFGIFIEPGRVRNFFFGRAANDAFERFGLQKGFGVGIDPDALFAPDLPQRLPRHIGMIEHLRVGRGNQQPHGLAEHVQIFDVAFDFGKHLVHEIGKFGYEIGDLCYVDPDAPLLDGIDQLRSREIATLAIAPAPRVVGAGAHCIDRHTVLGNLVKDGAQLLVAKQGTLVQPVFELDDMIAPQRPRFVVEILKYRAAHGVPLVSRSFRAGPCHRGANNQ